MNHLALMVNSKAAIDELYFLQRCCFTLEDSDVSMQPQFANIEVIRPANSLVFYHGSISTSLPWLGILQLSS